MKLTLILLALLTFAIASLAQVPGSSYRVENVPTRNYQVRHYCIGQQACPSLTVTTQALPILLAHMQGEFRFRRVGPIDYRAVAQ